MYYLNIDFSTITNMSNLIQRFSFLYNEHPGTEVNLYINIPSRVYPEFLAVLVSLVKYFTNKGIKFNINVNNPSNNTYVARIDFYRQLDIPFVENFNRWDSTGRFVEITNFDESNSVQVTNNILRVIRDNFNADMSIISCLNYCFMEMVDNVQVHAQSPIGGYTVAQNYPYSNELRIVIIDAGVGIYESLTKTQGTKYGNLSPSEALEFAIKEEVTNGKGRGNGLFHTSEFIKENKGEMQIYSGEYCLKISGSEVWTERSAYLQGTLIYVKINTKNYVDFYQVFGSNVPETVVNANDYIDDCLW